MNSITINTGIRDTFSDTLKNLKSGFLNDAEKTKKSNEEQVFQRIYETHYESIFNYMQIFFRERKTAEERTHTIFLSVWSLYKGYLSKNCPSIIDIFQIARNFTSNQFQEVQLKCNGVENSSIEFGRVALKEKYQYLSQQQRSIIYLVLIEGLSYQEVARVENSDLISVQGIYRNATRKLSM
jgi:DNA-directed RNA polymerase specialized sigma24 family protein